MYEDYMQDLLGNPMNMNQNTSDYINFNNGGSYPNDYYAGMQNNCQCGYNSQMRNNCQGGYNSQMQDNYYYGDYINRQYGNQNDNGCYPQRQMNFGMYPTNSFRNSTNEELEDMYPEIYKLVYPMIKKACMQNTKPLSREVVEGLTQEIYSNVEVAGDVVSLNINVDNNSDNSRTDVKKEEENRSDKESSVQESRVENRRTNNSLSDLIRILVLRELLGRPGNWGPNPPRPNPPKPYPPRPRYI